MSFCRRSVAALSGVFLLQLMLLGSGTLCAMQHSTLHQSGSGHTRQMARMAQQTSSHENSVVGANEADGPATPAEASNHDGCGVPLAPGQCPTMSVCTISAAPSEAVAASVPLYTVALILTTPARAHSGPTFAPELPPPRV